MKRLITLALGVAIGRAISRPDEAKAVLDKILGQVKGRTGATPPGGQAYDSPNSARPSASDPVPPPVSPDVHPSANVVDEWSAESFPASDAPSGWAGKDQPGS